jgi:hypothetical protein
LILLVPARESIVVFFETSPAIVHKIFAKKPAPLISVVAKTRLYGKDDVLSGSIKPLETYTVNIN